MSILIIAMYRCEVADKATDDVDYQVRYFTTDDETEVLRRLRSKEPTSYKNSSGEIVRWIFDDKVAIEHDPKLEDGAEIIGFITGVPMGITEGTGTQPSPLAPQSTSSAAETLRQTIEQAFADVPYPGDDRIATCSRPECDECAGIRWGLKALTPDLISPYVLEYHHSALALLLPEAFHYFVPMYMCYSVEHPHSEVAFFTRQNLGELDYEEFDLKRFCLFTAQQREAVIAFLEFLKTQEIEGDDQDQREYEDKLNDAIWIWKDLRRLPSLIGMSEEQIRELYQKQRETVQQTKSTPVPPSAPNPRSRNPGHT
jgi:hypothetical protein